MGQVDSIPQVKPLMTCQEAMDGMKNYCESGKLGPTCQDVKTDVQEFFNDKGITRPLGPSINEFKAETKGKNIWETFVNTIKYPFVTSCDEFVGKK